MRSSWVCRGLRPFGEELAAHMTEELGGDVRRGQVLKLAALLHDVAKPETRRVIDGAYASSSMM